MRLLKPPLAKNCNTSNSRSLDGSSNGCNSDQTLVRYLDQLNKRFFNTRRLYYPYYLARLDRFHDIFIIVDLSFLSIVPYELCWGRFVADAEAIYSYEGTREMNTLIVGKAITGFSAFV